MTDALPAPKYPGDCKADEQPDARYSLDPNKRQEARQPNVRHDKPSTVVAWDPRLALDIVLAGADKAVEVFAKYKVDPAAAAALIANPVFLKQLEQYRQEVEKSGMTYRMKARMLAEDLLPDAYEMARDPTYPAAVRADLIQWMTKVADLEPKKDVKDMGGGAFSLQIVFGGGAGAVPHQTVVGSSSAVPIEGESS